MDKITFSNKVDTKVTSVAEINKVTGANLNEIKNVTNLAVDQVLLKTDKGAYNGTSQDLKDAIDSVVFDGALTYQTVSDLPIAPYPAEGTPAKVANDPTDSNNGDWSVSSGAWIQNDTTGVYREVSRNFIHNEPTLNDAILSVDISEGDSINLAERTTGNGGGAIWDVVLSSSVTENTYNIVQCTGVSTLSLVLRVDDVTNVKQFGATGNGVTNDTPSIQAAIDSTLTTIERKDGYTLDALVGTVYFPKGAYVISKSDGFTVAGGYGLNLLGDGMYATKLIYKGDGAGSSGILNLQDSAYTNIRHITFYIDADHPCSHAVEINQISGAPYSISPSSTSMQFCDITGNDVMYQGIKLTYETEDAGNDFNLFRKVFIRGYTNFGVWLNGFQSHLNHFIDCNMSGLNLAEDFNNPNGEYAIYTQPQPSGICSSFIIEGGSYGAHKIADFFLGGTNQGFTIKSISQEHSAMLIKGSGFITLSLFDVRWDTENLATDAVFMNFPNGCNLEMNGCSINASTGNLVPKIKIDGDKGNIVRIQNCLFNTYIDSTNNVQTMPSLEQGSTSSGYDDVVLEQCRFTHVNENRLDSYLDIDGNKGGDFTLNALYGNVNYYCNTASTDVLTNITPLYNKQKITLLLNGNMSIKNGASGGDGINLKDGVDLTSPDLFSVTLIYNIQRGRWIEI